jgi:hypothetical protein
MGDNLNMKISSDQLVKRKAKKYAVTALEESRETFCDPSVEDFRNKYLPQKQGFISITKRK